MFKHWYLHEALKAFELLRKHRSYFYNNVQLYDTLRHLQNAHNQMKMALLTPNFIDNVLRLANLHQDFLPIMSNIREHQAAIQDIAIRTGSSVLKSLIEANSGYIQLFDYIPEARLISKKINSQYLHLYDLARQSKEYMLTATETFQGLASATLTWVSHNIIITQDILSKIDLARLAGLYSTSTRAESLFRSAFERLFSSFEELGKPVETVADLLALPPDLLPNATREVMITGIVLYTLYFTKDAELTFDVDVDIDEEKEILKEEFPKLLAKIDKSFLQSYNGALEAYKNKPTDYIRHVLSSLRELSGHVIRKLATDKAVKAHFQNEDYSEYCTDQGKIKRKARFQYIFREVDYYPLSEFVQKNATAYNRLFQAYNKLHDKNPEITEENLDIMITRTQSMLLFLIKLSNDKN